VSGTTPMMKRQELLVLGSDAIRREAEHLTHPHKSVTKVVVQECPRSVTRALRKCYESECYKSVT
jgi:hypothetical protein